MSVLPQFEARQLRRPEPRQLRHRRPHVARRQAPQEIGEFDRAAGRQVFQLGAPRRQRVILRRYAQGEYSAGSETRARSGGGGALRPVGPARPASACHFRLVSSSRSAPTRHGVDFSVERVGGGRHRPPRDALVDLSRPRHAPRPPSSARARRLARAADYVLRSYTELFGSIEVLLDDRSGVVRAQAGVARHHWRGPAARERLLPRRTRSGRPERRRAASCCRARGRCCSRRCTRRAAAAPRARVLPVPARAPRLRAVDARELHEPSSRRCCRCATLARPETAPTAAGLSGPPRLGARPALGVRRQRAHLRAALGPLWAASAPVRSA